MTTVLLILFWLWQPFAAPAQKPAPNAGVQAVPSERDKKPPLVALESFTVLHKDLEQGVYEDKQCGKMYYRYFVPKQLPAGAKVPLVLFLHGLGAAGSDNNHLRFSPSALIFVQPQVQAKYPCVFVAPQSPADGVWNGGSPDSASDPMLMALKLVDQFAENYPIVDKDRLYVTGLSNGGVGIWDVLGKQPGKFAAAVPIAGCWFPEVIQGAQNVSVWAFYNKDENEHTRKGCDNMLKAIAEHGGVARLTVYPSGGHNSWTAAYSEPGLIPWLFAQTLARPQPAKEIPNAKFWRAIAMGDTITVSALLQANPGLIRARDERGATPLHHAARCKSEEVIKLLLANKADVNARDNLGRTPLHHAVKTWGTDQIELLLANKADVNAKDNDGWSPLWWAVFRGNDKITEILLAHAADINVKDNDGKTLLRWAVENNYHNATAFLRAHGAKE